MGTLLVILSIVLALAFLAAGGTKVAGIAAHREGAAHLGYTLNAYRLIGGLEVAGAAGLAIGLGVGVGVGVGWIGVAAGVGLTLMRIGAVIAHLRVKDPSAKAAPAAVLGLLSLATVVLHLL